MKTKRLFLIICFSFSLLQAQTTIDTKAKYPFTLTPSVVWTMYGETKPTTIKIISEQFAPNLSMYDSYQPYTKIFLPNLAPFGTYLADISQPMAVIAEGKRYMLLPKSSEKLFRPKRNKSDEHEKQIEAINVAVFYLGTHHYLNQTADNQTNTLASDSVLGYILSERFEDIETLLAAPKNTEGFYFFDPKHLTEKDRAIYLSDAARKSALGKGFADGLKMKNDIAEAQKKMVRQPETFVEEYITKAESYPKTTVKWEQESYDFHTIKEGEEVTFKFVFSNTGNNDLYITHVKPSCGCTAPSWSQEPVKPGEKGFIEVKFNSTGKSGQQSKSIRVTGNFEGEITQSLKFVGEVTQKKGKNK